MVSNAVFVVHGRNEKIRKSMFSFLRSIGIHPLEWSEIVAATKKSSPYMGEVLQKGFSMAQAVIVLMTPDDEAVLREEFRKDSDPEYEKELTPQPRPNVLIEAGMALGMHSNRTIIVEFGQIKQISDIIGKNVIRMDSSSQQRNKLVQRLRTAGCEVNTKGNDWLTEGDFELDQHMESSKQSKSEVSKIQSSIIEKKLESIEIKQSTNSLEKLVKLCDINEDEIKNVISLTDDQIEIVAILQGGSLYDKQLTAVLCILVSHEAILNRDWVKASTLIEYMKAMGIPDKGNNLTTYLKRNSHLFIKRGMGRNAEYKLTTTQGRNTAYSTIRKLAKGEKLEN